MWGRGPALYKHNYFFNRWPQRGRPGSRRCSRSSGRCPSCRPCRSGVRHPGNVVGSSCRRGSLHNFRSVHKRRNQRFHDKVRFLFLFVVAVNA